MAIKINQSLQSESGLTIPEGSFISYETRFRPVSLKPIFILYWSIDENNAKAQNYMGEIPVNFDLTFIQEGLTKAEFLALNILAVEQLVIDYLENTGGIPSANLERVDILPND